jgi:uncharacterized protein (TIGR00730 family)
MKSVCIYCASNTGVRPEYMDAATHMGVLLATLGIRIVFGGGRVGLMGALAEGALLAGGEVIGVMPHSLVQREAAHQGLSELIVVNTMHERKAKFNELSDGFMILPGGIGTLEEFFETWTWAHLGVHAKPIGMLNVLGYWDPMIACMDHMASEGFLRANTANLIIVEEVAKDLLDQMQKYVPPAVNAWVSLPEI